MTISNFQLPNQVNGGSRSADYDTRYATALKLFSGEVFTAFNAASIFKGLVRQYDLRGGKSKQFLLPRSSQRATTRPVRPSSVMPV